MSDLTSGPRETIHLFTVDLPEDALWDFVTEDPDSGDFPLRDALGVEALDEAAVEGAVAEDLEGIGLTGFLTEGIGVEDSAIAAAAMIGERSRPVNGYRTPAAIGMPATL